MKKHSSSAVFLFVFSFFLVIAGYSKENKNNSTSPQDMVEEGNSLLKKGQFNAAIAVWQKVLDNDKNNANANFKMGMCYYNSIDEQPKALPY